MKLQKTLVLPIAALLVVGAAGAVLATSGTPAGSGSDTVVPAVESASPAPSAGTTKPSVKDTALSEVLDDLVAKGTITAAQKTAILEALDAERDARRAARDAAREQLQGFLADGAITQDELDQLPEDSPLRQLTDLMDDGKITTDELRGLGRGFGGRGGHGHGHGGGMWGAPDADASASPSTSS